MHEFVKDAVHKTFTTLGCPELIDDISIEWKQRFTARRGREWKQCMRLMGLEPRRCHTIDRTGLKRKVQRHLYTCECGTGYHQLSTVLHKRVSEGRDSTNRCHHYDRGIERFYAHRIISISIILSRVYPII